MDDERIAIGSGNPYADPGLPDAEELLTKSKLARQVLRIIDERSWPQKQAGIAPGVDQPQISLLMRGRLRGFSVDRLIGFLNRLDQDVEIFVHPRPADRATGRTVVHERDGAIAAAPVKRNGIPCS